jgi:DNA-binding transcriptional LysR family regulator
MYLKHLWYLHLVVTEGSFAAAARAASVSQPAITLAMRSLEAEWGTPLFEKVGRQKRPTRTAIAAARRAAALHRRMAMVGQQEVGAKAWLQDAGPPSLRIGLAPAAALLYGPVIEKAWRAHEPEGLLRTVSGSAPEILLDVQRGDLDLAIVPRPRRYRTDGLKCHPLHVSTPAIYARDGHPLNAATSLLDISQAGWAVAGHAGTAGNVIEEAHRVRKLPPPRILVQCADYMAATSLVAHTDLLCMIPHPALLQICQGMAIEPLRIREGLPRYEVCLFWRSAQPEESMDSVRAVIAALTALPLQG